MKAALLRVKHSIALLAERHGILFAVLDALFLFAGVIQGLMNSDDATGLYIPFFLIPVILIAVPMLADCVAVERRSGTLDLALTSPGARFYFERRVAAVVALMVAQGWFTMIITRLLMEPFPLSGPFIQVISVSLFIGAVALNWAVRLKTAGAVMFATYATALAFAPWLFSIPIHPPTVNNAGPMTVADIIHWTQNNLVLLASAAVAYAYARQRLMRPELIIA